eukprot:gene14060-biopygen1890
MSGHRKKKAETETETEAATETQKEKEKGMQGTDEAGQRVADASATRWSSNALLTRQQRAHSLTRFKRMTQRVWNTSATQLKKRVWPPVADAFLTRFQRV